MPIVLGTLVKEKNDGYVAEIQLSEEPIYSTHNVLRRISRQIKQEVL